MDKIYEGRKDFVTYLKLSRPDYKLYNTVSGRTPFSIEYQTRVPFLLEDRSFPSVVGTAFDYLARFMVATVIKDNKEDVFKDLVAFKGLNSFEGEIKKEFTKHYEDALEIIKIYIHDEDEISLTDVTRICCFLARLEHCSRTSWIPNEEEIHYLRKENRRVVNEVNMMGVVFYEEFIVKKMVKTDSIVIYNPSFGVCSKKLKGADGDIFIDGVLWDFKTTKMIVRKWQDETQMWQYLVYDNTCKLVNDQTASLFKYKIKALAFYKARFGEIEYLKIKDINIKQLYAVSRTMVATLENIDTSKTIDEALQKTNRNKIFTE